MGLLSRIARVLIIIYGRPYGPIAPVEYKMKTKRVTILGMKFAGKTTLLNYLRGKTNIEPEGTTLEFTEPFYYKKKNGEIVHVFPSNDTGGDQFKSEAEDMVKECNEVWFLFDVKLYLTDLNYRREVHHKTTFLNQICPIYHNDNYNLVLWGTHIDLIADADYRNNVKDLLMQNNFYDIVRKNNIEFINTTNF